MVFQRGFLTTLFAITVITTSQMQMIRLTVLITRTPGWEEESCDFETELETSKLPCHTPSSKLCTQIATVNTCSCVPKEADLYKRSKRHHTSSSQRKATVYRARKTVTRRPSHYARTNRFSATGGPR